MLARLGAVFTAGTATLLLSGTEATRSRPSVAESCDVRGVYSPIVLPFGTLASTTLGSLEEISEAYAPRKLDDGSYSVTVTRRSKDFYRVDGTEIYLTTRFCYHYGYSDKAVLRWQSLGSFGSGTITWE